MPAVALYIGCFMFWVLGACFVWGVGILLLIPEYTHDFAVRLCSAVAGTFPFVFAYQILTAPLTAAFLFLSLAFVKLLVHPGSQSTPASPVVIAIQMGILFVAFGAMFMASVVGFYQGWLTGWAYGGGLTVREAIDEGAELKPFGAMLRRSIHALYVHLWRRRPNAR